MSLFQETTNRFAVYPAAPSAALWEGAREVAGDLPEIRVYRGAWGGWLYRLNDGGGNVPFVAAMPDHTCVACYVDDPAVGADVDLATRFLLRTAFECRFCHEGIVSLHAACVEVDGWAVAFTGPSGLGKSTRAQAWVDGLGARWVSGDRPAVRLEAQGCTACGVPWDGKEQIMRDVERPLRCILEVRRSPANYLRRLRPDQARRLLVQQSFVPMWDTDAAVLALANARRMTHAVPVYRAFCGPEPADARALYDVLCNHPELIKDEADDMRIKNGFVLRTVIDEYMVMPTGDAIATFDGTVVLNEVAAFIFRQLENPVSREDLLAAVVGAYGVDEATAAADLDELLASFEDMGILER